MSTLPQLRADLCEKLKTLDFNTFSIIPEVVTPPFAAVAPSEPYIEFSDADDLAYDEVIVNHRIILVAEAGANDKQADDLDLMVVKVLQLDLDPFLLNSVGEPGRINVNGQTHLGVAVNVSSVSQIADL
jgi:hypothetical protein